MKRLNMPKGCEHLFDGSKLFCDFTKEEKSIYKYYLHLTEKNNTKEKLHEKGDGGMERKGYPTLKWAALQASEKSGLPFLTEEGNFTPEFKAFWQIFEEDIRKWENELRHEYMRWIPTIVSLMALIISIIVLVIRLAK